MRQVIQTKFWFVPTVPHIAPCAASPVYRELCLRILRYLCDFRTSSFGPVSRTRDTIASCFHSSPHVSPFRSFSPSKHTFYTSQNARCTPPRRVLWAFRGLWFQKYDIDCIVAFFTRCARQFHASLCLFWAQLCRIVRRKSCCEHTQFRAF